MDTKSCIKVLEEDLKLAQMYLDGDGSQTGVGIIRAKEKVEAYSYAIDFLKRDDLTAAYMAGVERGKKTHDIEALKDALEQAKIEIDTLKQSEDYKQYRQAIDRIRELKQANKFYRKAIEKIQQENGDVIERLKERIEELEKSEDYNQYRKMIVRLRKAEGALEKIMCTHYTEEERLEIIKQALHERCKIPDCECGGDAIINHDNGEPTNKPIEKLDLGEKGLGYYYNCTLMADKINEIIEKINKD